jgi:hypothetical protein
MTRKIATAQLVPMAALGVLAAVPAVAEAAPPRQRAPRVHITRAEWERMLPGHPDEGPGLDLCRSGSLRGNYACGDVWGALSHASQDAFKHGGYTALSYGCLDVDAGAGAGQTQWSCGGIGYRGGAWHNWQNNLDPYGATEAGTYYD